MPPPRLSRRHRCVSARLGWRRLSTNLHCCNARIDPRRGRCPSVFRRAPRCGSGGDAMLVDVTVRRIHKRQYITAAPLSRAHAYPCAVRRTITLVHGPLSREALLSFRVWTQTSLGDQARLDLRNAGLGSVKRIRVRVHGVGAQTRARNGAGRPNPGRIRCRLELGTRSPPPMARTPRGLRRAMARRSPPPRCRWRPSTPSPARVEPLALND